MELEPVYFIQHTHLLDLISSSFKMSRCFS